MAKRRKKSAGNLPAKGRLLEFADRLWALNVKAIWQNRCAMCERRGGVLNAHHLIPRQHQTTRFDLCNGICLCSSCHLWCPDRSPHQAAAGFLVWLKGYCPVRYQWLMRTTESADYKSFKATVNAAYYIHQIRDFRPHVYSNDFQRIVGVRFAAYLADLPEE